MGLGMSHCVLGAKEAVMAVAWCLLNPVGRTFMVERMEELMNIPDDFLRLFDDDGLNIAAKYVVQQQLGTFVLDNMVGAGYEGGRNKATPGEINDFQNLLGGMGHTSSDVLEAAIGYGKALGFQKAIGMIKRKSKSKQKGKEGGKDEEVEGNKTKDEQEDGK